MLPRVSEGINVISVPRKNIRPTINATDVQGKKYSNDDELGGVNKSIHS